MRPLGKITSDLEVLLEEMIDKHDMQRHEIIGIIDSWITLHRPDALEVYTKTGKIPRIYYE